MFSLIKNLLFPKRCLNCRSFGSFICANCRSKLIYLEKKICIYCEKESFTGKTHTTCSRPNSIDSYVGVFHYKSPLKKIIAGIKYQLVYDSFEELFSIINTKKEIFNAFAHGDLDKWLIQPIPLHKQRENERGFNQARIIAKWLASKVDAQVIDSLERVRYTRAQAQLGKEERQVNIRGAFIAKNSHILPQKRVILVDDVVTTGNTTTEAANVLKQAGASEVWVFSIAKG